MAHHTMQQLGKRKQPSCDSPPTPIPQRLSDRSQQSNPEHSPSLMRFIRSLFRPGWENENETGLVEGGTADMSNKKPKTDPSPSLAAQPHTTTPSSFTRTHTKEVHQRRRRHKRTNSLSSLSQLSSQAVLPAKRLDFGAGGRSPSQHSDAVILSAALSDQPRKTELRGLNYRTLAVKKGSGYPREADTTDVHTGDNADGPYAAGTTLLSVAEEKQTYRSTDMDSNGKCAEVGLTVGVPGATTSTPTEQLPDSETETPLDEGQNGAVLISSVVPSPEPDSELSTQTYNPYEHIRYLPPRPVTYNSRVLLPHKQIKKPTLVLDLDETLVHSTIEPPPPGSPPCDHVFSVTLENITYNVFVRVRPNMHQFLDEVAKLFEVVVFTASQEAYAGRLLDMLDTEKRISHRLYRDACVYVEGNFVKDLSMLGRDLQRTIIVDNSPLAFAYHLDNGIPIESWFGERSDNHLIALLPFLRELARTDDVRPPIRKKFCALRGTSYDAS